jgi:hypothetical protein
VFTVDIQAEVLGLLRLILITFLPRQMGGAIARGSLQNLLQVPDVTIQSFEKQLFAIGSENKQRALIRSLVAEAGNADVRKLLLSGTPSTATAALASTKPKKTLTDSSGDDPLLGGAIFNLIFNS